METGLIKAAIQESAATKLAIVNDEKLLSNLEKIGGVLKDVLANSGTVYSCGNGGSCCDAMHLTEELVARYKKERHGFKAVCFSDAGGLTCWSNDYDYQSAFARYAETFCTPKDVLLGFTTSGNSQNVIQAFVVAKQHGCKTVAFTGNDGGKIKDIADISLIVPASNTARIQEAHITFVHAICEMLEAEL